MPQGNLEAYKEEFVTREIYPPGLNSGNPESDPSPQNTHAVIGPNGLFNVHNIGLPLLLAIPYKISGVHGCKAFMILNGGVIILLLWKIVSLLCTNENIKFLEFFEGVINNIGYELNIISNNDFDQDLCYMAGSNFFLKSVSKVTNIVERCLVKNAKVYNF
mgnify:CR=1 FL=1